MDTNLQKMMSVISGKSRDEFELGHVSDTDKKQLLYALETLFSGLTLLNWLDGGRLLDAWKKSLNQMRAMIFEIKETNPVVMFLRLSVFDSNASWIKTMTQSDSSNELIQCPENGRDEWKKHADTQITEAVSIIRQKIDDFTYGQPKLPTKNQEVVQNMAHEMLEKERAQQRDERVRSYK
jgi:hypothetical protein